MAGNDERPYYGRARIAAGLILFALAAVLSVLDVVSPEYEVDSIQLGLLLGTGTILLGVEGGIEAARRISGGRE